MIWQTLGWIGVGAVLFVFAWFLIFIGLDRRWVFFVGGATGYSLATLYVIHVTSRQSFKNQYFRRVKGLTTLVLLIEIPVVICLALFYTQQLPLPSGMGLYWVGIVILAPCAAECLKYLLRNE